MNGYEITGIALLCAAAAIVLISSALRNRKGIVYIGYSFAVASVALSAVFFALDTKHVTSRVGCGYAFAVLAYAAFFAGVMAAVKKKKHKLWWFAGLMLVTVVFLQTSINVAYPFDLESGERLSGLALAARSVSTVFQTFSMDAGYVEIILLGEAAFGGGAPLFCYLSFAMTVIAPATGGFAVFGLLCKFFPYLWLYVYGYKRTRYVFSELNEYSIEIAESIAQKKNEAKSGESRTIPDEDKRWLKSSVTVFTDVYTDGDAEISSELFERARKIGAICVKDDISECNIRPFFGKKNKKIVYFLTDKDEENNLKTATAVLAPDNKKLRRAGHLELYVFTQNEDAGGIIHDAYRKLTDSERGKGADVYCKTINEYKNLVYRLIDGYDDGKTSYPLYRNLKDGKHGDLSKLSVLVVGGGRIGKEFIKAAYWCGQMLKSVDPAPKTASAEKADGKSVSTAKTKRTSARSVATAEKADGDAVWLPFEPTALKISVLAANAKETERKLAFEMPEVFSDSVKAHRYCDFYFSDVDYGTACGGFSTEFEQKCRDADYVLVALGDDELNIQAAHWIKRSLDRVNIGGSSRIPVNYVIENADLCRALAHHDASVSERGCVLHAFGSLAQRYDFDNICMSELERRAWIADRAHGGRTDKSEFLMNDYALDSSIASVMHYPYKSVVLGNSDHTETLEKLRANSAAVYWLEHRRWCAYIRSIGTRCPSADEYLAYAFEGTSYNNAAVKSADVKLKLHQCLLECGASLPSSKDIEKWHKLHETEIKDAVDRAKKTPTNARLDEWLYAATPFLPAEYDALDRLGVLVGIDYKAYDVKIVRDLYADELRYEILNGIHVGDPSACTAAAELLTDAYASDADDRVDAYITPDVRIVRVGAWDKFDILAIKCADIVKANDSSASDFAAALRGEAFEYELSDGIALAGIPFGEAYDFCGHWVCFKETDGERILSVD